MLGENEAVNLTGNDDDEDITYIRNKNGERVPQPPKKGRGNTLFREGNNDSPKQKQIKGK